MGLLAISFLIYEFLFIYKIIRLLFSSEKDINLVSVLLLKFVGELTKSNDH